MTSNADITIRIQAISGILDKMSSCIDALTERLEQLTELRDEAECEFEIYSDESKERNAALELQFTALSGRHSVLERPLSGENGRPFLVITPEIIGY